MRLARSAFRALLRARPPVVDGHLTLRGIAGPVTVRRDRWHVPHVEASTAPDAWWGLGFAQGQDRAFQITSFVHVAAGRLAELTGEQGLPVDRLLRRLGLTHVSRAGIPALSDEVGVALDAFARGVTAGMTVGSSRPAVEFTLLRATPRPVTAVDVASVVRLFAFLLAANWQDELARLTVLQADGPEALRALDDRAAHDLPTTLGHPEGEHAALALAADLEALARWVPVGGASNNWAIAGDRTRSGLPIVANDPHLPPSLPSFWYLAHVTCPEWSVAGAALPGTPAIAAGHNGHGAWGTTAGHCDETDLFLEQLGRDAEGAWTVREGDDVVPAEVRHEVIHVKGGSTHVEEVVVTPRGPVVGPALGGAPHGLSLAATWLDPDPIEGYLALPRARSTDAFHEAFRAWPGMSLNVVWGDRDGHVAWQLAGGLPVRRTGHGTLPLPGWIPDVGWDGRVPYDDLPHLVDPPTGWVATANNVPVPHGDHGPGSGPFLGVDHLEGYRVAAIGEVLAERDDWTVAATLAAQQDTRSLPWRRARPLLVDRPRPEDPDAAVAWGLLASWDGDVAADSAGAAVYELTMAGLRRALMAHLAPRSSRTLLEHAPVPGLVEEALGGLRGMAHTLAALEDPDRLGVAVGRAAFDVDARVEAALAAAVRTLRTHGDHVDDWAWGRVRPLRLRHAVSASAGLLAPVFDRGPFPLGGDSHTISQASPMPATPLADPLGVVSLRMAVDLGDLEASRWVLPGGQSGDPSSPHYDDQLAVFLSGGGIPIPWSDAAVAHATVHTLTLDPA